MLDLIFIFWIRLVGLVLFKVRISFQNLLKLKFAGMLTGGDARKLTSNTCSFWPNLSGRGCKLWQVEWGILKIEKLQKLFETRGMQQTRQTGGGGTEDTKETNAIVDLLCVAQPCNKVETTNHEHHMRTLIRGALNKFHSLSGTLVRGSYFACFLHAVSSKTILCKGFKGWMLYFIFFFFVFFGCGVSFSGCDFLANLFNLRSETV